MASSNTKSSGSAAKAPRKHKVQAAEASAGAASDPTRAVDEDAAASTPPASTGDGPATELGLAPADAADPGDAEPSQAKADPEVEPAPEADLAPGAVASGVGVYRVLKAHDKLPSIGTEIRMANARAAGGVAEGFLERI